MRKYLLVALAVCLAVLIPGPAASAQSAVFGGAIVDRFNECTDGEIYVICNEGQVITNYIEAPNGRRIAVFHFDVTTTMRGTEAYPCHWDGRYRDHTQNVFVVDAEGYPTEQQEHYIRRSVFSSGCEGAPTVTCTDYALLHEVDNQLTFWRYETVCTEEAV